MRRNNQLNSHRVSKLLQKTPTVAFKKDEAYNRDEAKKWQIMYEEKLKIDIVQLLNEAEERGYLWGWNACVRELPERIKPS